MPTDSGRPHHILRCPACQTALWSEYGGRPELRWTLAGALAYCSAFIVWLAVVAPVNSQIAAAVAHAPDSVPQLWMQLRGRWEHGHAAGFVLQLAGLASFLWSVLAAHPKPCRQASR